MAILFRHLKLVGTVYPEYLWLGDTGKHITNISLRPEFEPHNFGILVLCATNGLSTQKLPKSATNYLWSSCNVQYACLCIYKVHFAYFTNVYF